MPRSTSERSTAPTALRAMLRKLDALRTKIADQTKDAEQLARQALAAFKRDSLGDEIFISPNRKAIIVTPDEITIDAARFREAALMAGVDTAVAEACFDLSHARAAGVIGQSKLDEITTRKPGKPQIRFTGKR